MQPAEAINFFSEQSVRAEKGLVAAESTRNYQLFALSARQLFKTRLMRGLITWRQGEDASQLMTVAVDTLDRNAAVLADLNAGAAVGADLPLERAAIVAFLIDKPIRFPLSVLDGVADKRLDCALVSALDSNQVQIDLDLEISRLTKVSALAAQSYRLYFDILNRFSSGISVDDLIVEAEENFQSRATDGFYSGGEQTEGGGPDNKLVVDYRLAAVLKKANYSGRGIHLWRW